MQMYIKRQKKREINSIISYAWGKSTYIEKVCHSICIHGLLASAYTCVFSCQSQGLLILKWQEYNLGLQGYARF